MDAAIARPDDQGQVDKFCVIAFRASHLERFAAAMEGIGNRGRRSVRPADELQRRPSLAVQPVRDLQRLVGGDMGGLGLAPASLIGLLGLPELPDVVLPVPAGHGELDDTGCGHGQIKALAVDRDKWRTARNSPWSDYFRSTEGKEPVDRAGVWERRLWSIKTRTKLDQKVQGIRQTLDKVEAPIALSA